MVFGDNAEWLAMRRVMGVGAANVDSVEGGIQLDEDMVALTVAVEMGKAGLKGVDKGKEVIHGEGGCARVNHFEVNHVVRVEHFHRLRRAWRWAVGRGS